MVFILNEALIISIRDSCTLQLSKNRSHPYPGCRSYFWGFRVMTSSTVNAHSTSLSVFTIRDELNYLVRCSPSVMTKLIFNLIVQSLCLWGNDQKRKTHTECRQDLPITQGPEGKQNKKQIKKKHQEEKALCCTMKQVDHHEFCCHDFLPHHVPRSNRAKDYKQKSLKSRLRVTIPPSKLFSHVFIIAVKKNLTGIEYWHQDVDRVIAVTYQISYYRNLWNQFGREIYKSGLKESARMRLAEANERLWWGTWKISMWV